MIKIHQDQLFIHLFIFVFLNFCNFCKNWCWDTNPEYVDHFHNWYRYRWSIVQECRCPGPPAQLGPLHGPWLLAECTPVGDKAVPGGTKVLTGEATDRTLTDGHSICGSTESRPKANTTGSETKRLDLGGNVATHRRESLHAPGPAVQAGEQAEVGKGYQEESHAGQTEEDGGGGSGGGGYDEGGPTSRPRGVVPPSGVVQGGSGPRPATCPSYAQAGHGGACHTLQPGTPPGDTIPVTI